MTTDPTLDLKTLENTIETTFENRQGLQPSDCPEPIRTAINETLTLLDQGKIRVAEKQGDSWQVNQWVKKAVLLSFQVNANQVVEGGFTQYYDKVPMKFSNWSDAE